MIVGIKVRRIHLQKARGALGRPQSLHAKELPCLYPERTLRGRFVTRIVGLTIGRRLKAEHAFIKVGIE